MIFFEKSTPAPACLEIEKVKASGDYNCGDVLARLASDFKNKCYVCEYKAPHSINTEHFKPHKGNKELKFDWNNLFFCCGHCNNTKLANPIYDEILNCTVREDKVDTKIKYKINPIPKELPVFTALEDTPKVHNTITLLKAVYNGTTQQKTLESANLRDKLLKEIREFTNYLFEYENDEYNAEEKQWLKDKIIRQLRKTSNFTAFKRWIILDSEHFTKEFAHLIEAD